MRAIARSGALTSGWTLRRKVPLFIGGGLAIVLAAWLWLSYRGVREASLASSADRLSSLTRQLATTYSTGMTDYAEGVRTSANAAPIVDFLRAPGAQNRAGAESAMRRMMDRRGLVHRVELFAPDGTPVLAVPGTVPVEQLERHPELESQFERLNDGTVRSTIANLRVLDDTVVLPAIAAVLDNGRPIGYTVVWRELRASEQARTQFSAIAGQSAQLYVGNARGDVWSDLGGTVSPPPVDLPSNGVAREYQRPGQTPVFGAARRVPGTPLVMLVEFSEASVLAPAHRFVERSALFSLALLVVATVLASQLSRRITKPLERLTESATLMAAGQVSQPVHIDRHDEIGQLSAAFNTMGTHVDNARQALEDTVVRRTAQLQERNEELEAFAHSISHDLRAPLRAMHGFSQALLDDFGPTLDPVAQDYARRIANGAQRMDLLIQDLLAYSRISRAEIALVPVDLGMVTRDALAQLEADTVAAGARVTVREPLAPVLAHRAILEQVLANLVANALKFVAPGRTPEVTIRTETAPGRVRLWVEDNGIGIGPEHHQRIFSVFERLHQPDEFAGTGIGLAIVRKGIERMGGRTGVESAPGTGSRFWLELRSPESI